MSLGHSNLKDEFLTGEFLNLGRDIIIEIGVWGGPLVVYVSLCICELSPTICGPVDCSLLDSLAQGIFQARTLKWGAISYSRGGLPDPGVEPMSLVSPAWAGRFFTTSPTWEADLYHKTFIHALDAVDWEGRNIQVWIYSLSNCIILGNIFSFSLGSSSYNGDQISVIDDSGDDCVRECL